MTDNVRVLAVDRSLTSTAWAYGTLTRTIKGDKLRGPERLDYIWNEIAFAIQAGDITHVVTEGYAFGKGFQAHQIGELGGLFKVELWRAGIPCGEVTPAQIKQFATGKGNAKKDDMIEAAIRHFGFTGHGNDEADAWLMLCMAEVALGVRGSTARQLEIARKVVWPW